MKNVLAGLSLFGAAACGIGLCVARGSQVRVPKGTRPIEDLMDGDEVLCVDPHNGQTTAAMIFAVRQTRRECVKLQVNGTQLICTSDHPVYCPRKDEFAPAGDWVLGKRSHLLYVRDHGVEAVNVVQVAAYAGVFDVFDITVDHPLHNFVADGILVHNKSPPPFYCPTECTVNGLLLQQGASCACADGPSGTVECGRSSGAFCAGCKGADAADGGTDGGTVDAGIDCFKR